MSELTGSVVVFGSTNIDIVTHPEHLPRPGETVFAGSARFSMGGKGANQAIASRRLGSPVRFYSVIGKDSFGEMALDFLRKENINTDTIRISDATSTGLAFISIDANAENTITVISGANATMTVAEAEQVARSMTSNDILLLQMELPAETVENAACAAKQKGCTVILDPAPVPVAGLTDRLLQHTGIITPNSTEAKALTGVHPHDQASAIEAANRLRARGPEVAIVKLGADGVYYQSETESGFIPPFPVVSIDSVAAGDCFNGGLAHALHSGFPLRESVRYAAACGALATTRKGAGEAAPSAAEVLALMQQ